MQVVTWGYEEPEWQEISRRRYLRAAKEARK